MDEIEQIAQLVGELEAALAIEQEAGCDLARWGEWSHHWNRRRQALLNAVLECRDTSLPHRRALLACVHLFDAWQRIHYRITQHKPPDVLGLEEVKRRLREAAEAKARSI